MSRIYSKIVFVLSVVFTIGAVILSFAYGALAGVFTYDYNFHAMRSLTPEQANGIVQTVRNLIAITVWPLIVATLGWMTCAIVLLAKLKLKQADQRTP